VACSPCTRGRCAPHDCLLRITPEEVSARALELLDPVEEAAREARLEPAHAREESRPVLRLVRSEAEEIEKSREKDDELAGVR